MWMLDSENDHVENALKLCLYVTHTQNDAENALNHFCV